MAFGKKKPKAKYEMFRLRKLADKTDQSRYVMFDEQTGEKKLVNPDTPGTVHEPWPLLGVQIEGDAPKLTTVSQRFAVQGQSEGWLQFENYRLVTRPGGPPDTKFDPTRVHNFVHADAIIFKCVDGDVKYLVTRQPDKYATKSDTQEVTDAIYAAGDTEVSWWFGLELVEDNRG
jgi:hypothetical protein